MATQAEHAAQLRELSSKVGKIHEETSKSLEKIIALEQASQAAGNTSPEVDAAIADLKEQLQGVDDLVADAEPKGGGAAGEGGTVG